MVEIAPNGTPPVCKIIDYSKFKYEQKKKQKELKANAHKVVVKEIRFGPNTNEHDLDFKTKHAQKFLEEGNKVKAYVQFAGRTIVFKDRGREILDRFAEAVEEQGKPEGYPKMEGKRMIIMFTPKNIPTKKKSAVLKEEASKDDKPKSSKSSKEAKEKSGNDSETKSEKETKKGADKGADKVSTKADTKTSDKTSDKNAEKTSGKTDVKISDKTSSKVDTKAEEKPKTAKTSKEGKETKVGKTDKADKADKTERTPVKKAPAAKTSTKKPAPKKAKSEEEE